MTTDTLSVPAVHCGHCVESIEGALKPLDGVQDASVDLETRDVTVSFDESAIDRDAIVTAIEDQGYDVEEGDAPDSLPMA